MVRASVVISALAWVVFTASAGEAQLDLRVNQDNPHGDGRALDRNPGLGTGGFNAGGGRFDYGLGANSIVTGNVTGLGGFKGFSPIVDSNRFRDGLPSAGLSGYFSRSISAADLQRNAPPPPTFYFGRQETVASLSQIRTGQNAPGSSMLSSPFIAPQPVSGGGSAFAAPTIRSPGDPRLSPGLDETQFGVRQVELPRTKALEPPRLTDFSLQSAADSSIFGVPPPLAVRPPPARLTPAGTSDTGRPLSAGRTALEEVELRGAEAAAVTSAADGATAKATPEAGEGFGIRQDDGGAERGPRTEFGVRQAVPASPSDPEAAQGPPPRHIRPDLKVTPGQTPADLGGDRFADMWRAVRASQQAGVLDLGFQVESDTARGDPATPEPDAAVTQPPTAGRPRGGTVGESPRRLQRRSDRAVAELAAAARWAEEVLESPVATFVGRNRTRFNDCMAAAESALHAGQYYRAADLFSLARTMNADDPLPLLGRGHALIAAGDYRTAAWCLQQGIARFPQIAAFRLDLVSLIGRPDVFDIRRADLEGRLTSADHFELRFILGYLEFYSGLPEEGLRNLRQAAEAAPPDSVIARFPELLTGERRLPDLAPPE